MTYFLEIYANGRQKEYWKNESGEYHRENGPAMIYYDENGQICEEQWCINGKHHRSDGPAVIFYHNNGQIARKIWYINNSLHRDDAPAIIEYDKNGQKIGVMWWNHGYSHRENGPAHILYDKDEQIYKERWYFNGHDITDVVKNIFGIIPDEINKEEQILLKLGMPDEYILYNILIFQNKP